MKILDMLIGRELDVLAKTSGLSERRDSESDDHYRARLRGEAAIRAPFLPTPQPLVPAAPGITSTDEYRKQQEFELCKVILPALIAGIKFDELSPEAAPNACDYLAAFACNVTRATLDKLDESPK